MKLINEDLRELELKASDLSSIFWRQLNSDGIENLAQDIKQQHLKVMALLDQKDFQQLRNLVSHVVALGAIRGLNWGLRLKDRDSRRKAAGDNQIVKCIIKHPKIVSALLQTPKVSTRDICLMLDNNGQSLPWYGLDNKDQRAPSSKLARVQNLWSDYYKHDTVKNAIKRARNEALQIVEDIRYLRPLTRA
jgi:hypothetical protein